MTTRLSDNERNDMRWQSGGWLRGETNGGPELQEPEHTDCSGILTRVIRRYPGAALAGALVAGAALGWCLKRR